MKLITDLDKFWGKTIVNAVSVDIGDSIAVVFSDDTYAVIGVENYGDSHDTVLLDAIDDNIKLESGAITQEEYDDIVEKSQIELKKRRKAFERKQLEELKAKYPEA